MGGSSEVRPSLKRKSTVLAAIGSLLALVLAGGALGPGVGQASSHREAPLVAGDPQVDNTDVYAFVSPDKPDTVTLISNFIPFEEPAGGPNFYAFDKHAQYDIKIDNNGDARPDIIYRWKFGDHYRNPGNFLYNTGPVTSLNDPDLNFYQTYQLLRVVPGRGATTLVKNAVAAPSDVGDASMPDYASLRGAAIKSFGTVAGASRVFAGQADDPFFLDLRVFDLLYGGDFSEVGDDTLAGFNVNTLALQVPKNALARAGDASKHHIIGIWSTASRPSTRVQRSNGTQLFRNHPVQVSRLGNPLVNEVVIPVKDKDKWNGSQPKDDRQFLPYVQNPILPHVVQAVYGIPAPDSDPNTPGIQRSDLISVFLTGVAGLNKPRKVTPSEELRLNMSIAPCLPNGRHPSGSSCKYSTLGVIGGDTSGFPNGRRLADDIVDVSLRVVEGVLLPNHNPAANSLSDKVDANDLPFGHAFPYLALPHSGSNKAPHG
jgi:Domain of unknown function (DUF4331)